MYGEMELIGPDCETQKPGWTRNSSARTRISSATSSYIPSSWRNAIRTGGDLNGRSQGRARFVNNTIMFAEAARRMQ